MLSDYQRYMRGVDIMDQHIGYYLLDHRSAKWWRRVFFYMMMVCANNSYIVAKEQDRELTKKLWPTFQDFLEALSMELIGPTRSKRTPRLATKPAQPLENHTYKANLFPKKRTCAECSMCREKGERVFGTLSGCVECGTPIHKRCMSSHVVRGFNSAV